MFFISIKAELARVTRTPSEFPKMAGTGVPLKFENPIGDSVSRIRFAPQSNNLLISSWDSNLRLYDVEASLLRLQAPCGAALLDCCFQTQSLAFSAASDGLIRSYDLGSGTIDTVGNHDDIATCVGYSNETCQVVSAGLDQKIVFWDTRRSQNGSVGCLRNLEAEIESFYVSEFDLVVATGASVRVYDLRNLETPVHSKKSCVGVRIRSISSIPYSRGYAVGSVDGRVELEISNPFDSNETGYAFRCHPKSKDGKAHLVSVNDIVFNPLMNGTFVTGDNEGYVIAWDAQSKRRLYEFDRHPNSVASISYNYEGQVLAVASSYTYQEAHEMEMPPQIYIQKMDETRLFSAGVSRRK